MAINLNNPQKKKGALQALEIILQSRVRPIELEEDEEDKLDENGLTMPKNTVVHGADSEDEDDADEPEETPEEKQERIDRINDPAQIQQDLADIKQDTQIRQNDIVNAKKKEAEKIARAVKGNLMDFANFSVDLFKAIKSQVGLSKHPEDTFMRPNPTYAGTDYLMPGQDYVEKKTIPSLAVYFDQSGSWGSYDVTRGKEAIACLQGFVAKHKIKKIDLYYFADHLHTEPGPARREGGTGGFDEVLENIQQHHYDNIIILTDSDIEGQTSWRICTPYQAKGCVWFLWKNGSRSTTALKYLSGIQATYEYKM